IRDRDLRPMRCACHQHHRHTTRRRAGAAAMDIADASDAELRQLKRMIDGELSRRETLATAEKRAADLNAEFLAAAGVTDGDVWRQPTSAVDAYPKDWTVTHDGKTWVSLTPANVWEPPTAWREVVEEGETPEWVQPTG